MTEWKTVKREEEYSTICVSAEDAPGLYRPAPPPLLYSYIGWLRNFCFRNLAKFLILCFAKFSSNFVKFKIILSKFRVSHNLLSATHPPLTSARRFFNAAWQCYFEMKTNTEPYFSTLSSIILWY